MTIRLKITIRPATAFATPLLGETLFGQLCWAIRHRQGEDMLELLLDGYCSGSPFAVISDAFAHDHLPLPSLPVSLWLENNEVDRKQLKKRCWIAQKDLGADPRSWRNLAKSDADLGKAFGVTSLQSGFESMHNTINRMTGTTGEGMFAPYGSEQFAFAPGLLWDVYADIDEDLISVEDFRTAFEDIGLTGFGKDASAGLGKFTVESCEEVPLPEPSVARLTLASCSMAGMQGVSPKGTYYTARTHFGRHGDMLVHGGNPFKKPLLLAGRGAVITFVKAQNKSFVGNGIAGVSNIHAKTVHQGYAPVIAISSIARSDS